MCWRIEVRYSSSFQNLNGEKGVKGVRVFLYLLYPEKVNTEEEKTWENMIIVYFISKSECERGKGGKGFPLPSLPSKSKYLRRNENHTR